MKKKDKIIEIETSSSSNSVSLGMEESPVN